ncbi:MAG TPA: hypothetical protein VGG19_15890 [Tepidisphaeraceae bacterium]|jgi:hypothetical protein
MTSRRLRAVLLAIVLLGIALRLAQWAYESPLWHDESAVVRNVEAKTAAQLMGPLWESVAAPPAFLFTLRGIYIAFHDTSLFHNSDLLYRTPALVSGSLALFLFALLSARLLSPAIAITVSALFALSDRLIWHSVEVKPYGTDVLVACVFLWIFLAIQSPTRKILLLSAVAVISIWFSFPTLFLYAALMLLLLIENFRNPRAVMMGMIGGVLFAGSLAAVYFLDIRPQRNDSIRENWISDYLPHNPLAWPSWLSAELYRLCDYSTKNMGGIFLALAILGGVALWRREQTRRILWLLVLPVLVALSAACAWLYPFGGSRATLFLVPCVFLLAGFGLQFLHNRFSRWGTCLSIGISIFLVIWMGALAGYHLVSPRMKTPAIRQLAKFVHDHYQPGEPVYVWAGRNGPDEFIDYWDHHVGHLGDPLFLLAPDHEHAQFWIVLIDATEFKETLKMPDLVDARAAATQKFQFSTRGGQAYLFERK